MPDVPLDELLATYRPGTFNTWDDALDALSTDAESHTVISALAALLERGETLRPIHIDTDDLVVLDGQHRVAAHLRVGAPFIAVSDVDADRQLASVAVRVACCAHQAAETRALSALRSMPVGGGWIEAHEGFFVAARRDRAICLTYSVTGALDERDVAAAVRGRLSERGIAYDLVTTRQIAPGAAAGAKVETGHAPATLVA